MKIEDTRAIVTGAGSGMGQAFALGFAEHGGASLAVDLNEEGLAETASAGSELAGSVATFAGDISDESTVGAMFEAAESAFGAPANVIVNCAGITRDALLAKKSRKTGDIVTMSTDDWQKVIDVNLTGPFFCAREFARRCIETDTKPAVIVNISSTSRRGNPGQTNYSAAKAGLAADTVLWGKELARYGIRVGGIAPGFVDTPMIRKMRPDILERGLGAVPLGRAGDPRELWLGVKFIVECDYFTARIIDIDGGVG